MITITEISQQLAKNNSKKTIADKASILIPIIEIDGQLQLLFQIRAQTLKWQPGDICFPGGRIELMDRSPEQTAIRETYEELGIPEQDITILGQLPKFPATLGLIIYPFVAQISSLDKLKLNPNEVEKILTVPIDWFITNAPIQATMDVGHKPADNFPFNLVPKRTQGWQKRSEHKVLFYHYNEYVIWGLTAQITLNFIKTISNIANSIN